MTAEGNLTEMELGSDPKSYKEALRAPDAVQWIEAVEAEYSMLIQMCTWELGSLPPKRKIVIGNWVFKSKRGPNGEVLKHKARFLAQGFTQVEGVHFNET